MGDTTEKAAADVYGGDISVLDSSSLPLNVFLFRIEADAEPDVLARVAGILNIANTPPQGVTLCRPSRDQVNISVAIELSSALTADMIRRKIEQLTCTISVELVITE